MSVEQLLCFFFAPFSSLGSVYPKKEEVEDKNM